jgi:ABC-type Fe3+-hydroxamate transport system substrate-binding protein
VRFTDDWALTVGIHYLLFLCGPFFLLERASSTHIRDYVGRFGWPGYDGADPLFAPGHWVHEQVSRAGGEPVIGQAGARSQEASWNAVAQADPEAVILGLCGFDLPRTLDEWTAFGPPSALRATSAWRDGELWAIDGSAYVSRPGPRLIDGVEILTAILSGRDDPRAARLSRPDR